MRFPTPRIVAAAALLLLLGAAVHATGCGGTEPTGSFEYTNAQASAAKTVAPGAKLAVTVTLVNAGDSTIKKDGTSLEFTGDKRWTGGALALEADTAPGETAKFSGDVTAPLQTCIFTLSWKAPGSSGMGDPPIALDVEVTCSDGVFCNGVEMFVNGACAAGKDPCDDGQPCTMDACDDATGRCSHETMGADCATCFSDCVADCTGKACGDDGCGGQCGACPAGQGCEAATGACADETQAGTCQNPLPLLQAGESILGKHVVQGDSTNGLNQTIPVCNNTSLAAEIVYSFTIDQKIGIQAMSAGYDTVLSLRKTCLDDTPAGTVACSDDSAPPSNYGSRVNAVLDPGTYFLIVDGFDATQFGPFTLTIQAAPDGCVPNCDGQFCGGNDGCGGDCGQCDAGFACKDLHCYPDPCTPDCQGRACGDDGCGGECGQCQDGKLCVRSSGTCQGFPECDHDVPECAPACAAGEICGTDCACHKASDPLPDLVVSSERLAKEILFDTIHVTETSCAVAEACVGGPGDRKVLRFSVEAINQGQVTLQVPPPDERPDLFTYSTCHGHYHFQGFASYELLDQNGKVVLTGRKQAYCMEDTVQVMPGPEVACSKQFDCSNQGIQAGWSDLYGNALDCQWLDVTDTPPGEYSLRVTLNPGRAFQELTFENNTATVPVTIE